MTTKPFEIRRRPSTSVWVGNVQVGGTAPISVQSMTNTATRDVSATVEQIGRLEAAGCEIVRVAVPDEAAASAIRPIKSAISIPLIADIHFDHRLAIRAAEAGADALRLNPGNIGGEKNIRAVVHCARTLNIPIRIGVNAGSLEKDLLKSHGGPTPEAMVESALRHISLLRELEFDQIKVSLKASDVPRTLAAYRLLARATDLPLHIGITEAGGLFPGIVKSSIGIGMLLAEGIGDTLRVSLTRDPVEEVRVGFEILKALGLRQKGPDIISCPTCGRTQIDLFDILEKVENALLNKSLPIKVAIMGCVVNGPGEAREADIGIAGGDGIGILFKKGKVIRKFPEDRLVEVLLSEIDRFETETTVHEKSQGPADAAARRSAKPVKRP
ncbi:MAG: flavodoxin-dependent (E)-4-hydroxy-3-methylbut-2-enyl-diphosphate synthase [Desulfobacterales bacterium]